MKQTFDWLREQMRELSEPMQDWMGDTYDMVDLCGALEVINEAEAKCKPQKVIKTHLHPFGSIIGDCPRCQNGVLAGNKFCGFCGIPLEVE